MQTPGIIMEGHWRIFKERVRRHTKRKDAWNTGRMVLIIGKLEIASYHVL